MCAVQSVVRLSLFGELQALLKLHDKTWDDVQWVGCSKFQFNKDEFRAYAEKVYVVYSDDFDDLVEDLLFRGDEWQLARTMELEDEYPEWKFTWLISKPQEVRHLTSLLQSDTEVYKEDGEADFFAFCENLNPPA